MIQFGYVFIQRPRTPSALSSQETPTERRTRLAKEKKKIIKEAIAETPKGCLSLKSVFSYNTIKKSYLNFLTEYNLREDNVNRPPLEPFTKWSFNTGMSF